MVLIDYNELTDSDFPDNLIQRLFPEILAEIFTLCLPDIPNDSLWVVPISSRKAPLLLCSVCSSWRSLAISSPRLWRTLHFCIMSADNVSNIDSITSGIRTWLDRSGALPLSIRTIFRITDSESDEATRCRLILEVLSQEISRWESFELHEDGIWVTPPHFGILPMLHTLDISGSFVDEIPITAAPRLKRLGLHSPCPNPRYGSAIPWDQLIELTIWEFQPISMVVDVIQRCPRLESLLMWVEDEDEDTSLTFRSITQHDTLRKLHLKLLPYVNAVTDRLTLPALTDLSLYVRCSTPEVETKLRCSQLLTFFTRSNCELQELALYNSGFGPSELLEYLSHGSCQTLARLLIHNYDYPPPIVDRELLIRLTYRDVDDDVPLCPKLRHLELNDCYCSDKSFPDLLGRIIHSRCFSRAQDAQLKSLRIVNRYPVSREDYELLQFSQSNGGLELEYSYIKHRTANNLEVIPAGDTGEDENEGDLWNSAD